MPKVKLFQRKKVQGLKVKVAENRGDRAHHLTEFGLRIQGKQIVPTLYKLSLFNKRRDLIDCFEH
jgi:hypothetical protein